MGAITQTISAIPSPGHRGVDIRDDFVTKQEAYQDHQRDTLVGELNTFATQANSLRTDVNAVIANETNINTVATNIDDVNTVAAQDTTITDIATQVIPNIAEILTADDSAATATTKASEASGFRDEAEGFKNDAAAIADAMDDIYLGPKASDPTLDNDGDALQDGAWYYNNVTKATRVYDLGTTTWVDGSFTPTDHTALTNIGTNTHAQIDAKLDHLTVTQATDLDTIGDKVGNISITQAVDLDALETRVNNLDASVVLMGTWDASSGSFPASTTTGESWIVSVGGTVDGVVFTATDRLIAVVDGASTTVYASNWHKADYTDVDTDLSYVAATRTLESSTGSDVVLPEVVASGDSGLMTGADKDKLDHITVTQAVDLDTMESDITTLQSASSDLTYNSTTRTVVNDAGTDAIITEVVASGDSGLMTGADKDKLDNIESNATADQTDGEIKIAYENNADTNAFTDTEKADVATVTRLDKIIAAQGIVSMTYTGGTGGNLLSAIDYTNNYDEVFNYDGSDNLQYIDHQIGGVNQSYTTLAYTGNDLTSVTYTATPRV